MKKIDKFSIILIIISITLFFISFYEAYRITTVLDYDEIEILFTYETFRLEILIMLVILYLIILVKYNDQYSQLHFTIRRSYLIFHLGLATSGYLLGLNLDYLLGNHESFSYNLLANFWIFQVVIFSIIVIDILYLYHKVNIRKNTKGIDILQVLLTILFILIFNIVLTDSTTLMGVFH
jgi:hypothetical protein